MNEPDAANSVPKAGELYSLPNGQRIVHRHKYETDFLYREIFINRVYLRHGITLLPGAQVVDVGANIGLFSLFIKLECPTARLFVFEPAQELFRLAGQNLQRFGADVRLFPLGLGESDQIKEFTYYPGYSIMSGFHAVPDRDRELLRQGVRNQLVSAANQRVAVSPKMVDALVGKKLDDAERYECSMTSLSNVMSREDIHTVDLLKIDAEKCEREVLSGIRDEHWKRIRQIVVEAHDRATAEELERTLAGHGFRVHVEQEGQFAESDVFNLYALRADA
jgi:FkbM family methyltransferase